MIDVDGRTLAAWLGGVTSGNDTLHVHGFSMDSRHAKKGDVFLAYPGDRYDGHDFIKDVQQQGVEVLIVGMGRKPDDDQGCCWIEVADPRKALLHLATAVRAHLQASVLAVTGSNGKTSVKDILKALLEPYGQVVATYENLNNEIGIAQTILRADEQTRYLVLEAGVSEPGDMMLCAPLIRPDVAIFTGVSEAHLVSFGSVLALAHEKTQLGVQIRPQGARIVNADNEALMHEVHRRGWDRVVCVGHQPQADWRLADEALDDQGLHWQLTYQNKDYSMHASLPGLFQASNITLALAAIAALHLDPFAHPEVLTQLTLTHWRMQTMQIGRATVILDAYKSNPESLSAALATLWGMHPAKPVVFLAPMADLGFASERAHLDVVTVLAHHPETEAYLFGAEFVVAQKHINGPNVQVTEDFTQFQQWFEHSLAQQATILVKGSRMYRLERLIEKGAEV